MHWHNHATHAVLRELQEARLAGHEVTQRKAWHEGQDRRSRPSLRRLAGWTGSGLVGAGERLRAWSATTEPAVERAEA